MDLPGRSPPDKVHSCFGSDPEKLHFAVGGWGPLRGWGEGGAHNLRKYISPPAPPDQVHFRGRPPALILFFWGGQKDRSGNVLAQVRENLHSETGPKLSKPWFPEWFETGVAAIRLPLRHSKPG